MSSALLRIDDDVTYIPSQQGRTCTTDSYETILCYADVVRHIFLDPFNEWLTPERAEGLTEFNPEYNALIRDKYQNSDYVRTILIRHLQRQMLEVRPLAVPAAQAIGLRRMPSLNKTRGLIARREQERNVVGIKSTAFNDGSYECPATSMELMRRLLPGILIFGRNPPLRRDWASTIVGAWMSITWIGFTNHATTLIRNNGKWYFCDDMLGYAIKIEETFYEHIVHTLVLGKRIEWQQNPILGFTLVVNTVSVLELPHNPGFVPAITESHVGSSATLLMKEQAAPYPNSFLKKQGTSDIQCFFVESTESFVTPAEMSALESRSEEIAAALVARAPPLPITVWRQLYDAIKARDEGQALSLIAGGTDLTFKKYTQNNATVLHIACRLGLEAVVHAILVADKATEGRRPRIINELDNEKNTALHLACETTNVEIVRQLIVNGVKINERNKYGETALCVACKLKNTDVALFLISQKGIDINVGNPLSLIEGDDTMTAVKAALLAAGADPAAETLYEYGNSSISASTRQLEAAISAKDSHTASLLLARGAKGTVKGFVMALNNKFLDIAHELVKDPDINVNGNYKGFTPLYIAVLQGFLDIAQELLERGATIDTLVGGFTTLYHACKMEKEIPALFLIEQGADVNIGSPISMFRSSRMPAVKAALLAKGAKDPLSAGSSRKATRRNRKQHRKSRKRCRR